MLRALHKLGCRIWKKCNTAEDWCQAFIVLLKKGDLFKDLDVVSEFRPICITATAGKIFMSILADRIQDFMVKNLYIPRKIQKGFLSGVAGCVEHSYMLFEALRDAKLQRTQIVVSWIDLANAYGSVRHNLIQFALDWYHVPKLIQKLIFDYYEKLMAKVTTKKWESGFFLFDIGLFQGCVLSAILFLCVFQLLLDYLKPLEEECGYAFKRIKNARLLTEAFADDLSLVTNSPEGNQKACDRTDEFLDWSKTMRAKPRKCISMAMKQFDKRSKSKKYDPVTDKIYSTFDPKLTIAGKPMHFILDKSKSDTFKGEHFKFLGRWIHYFLNEEGISNRTEAQIIEDLETIDGAPVNGCMKLWIYQFYLLPRCSWPLLIHDLCQSYALRLQTHAQPYLKIWSGVGRTVDPGVLYRTRARFGLGLTSLTSHYRNMQLIKCQLLDTSIDDSVRNVYAARRAKYELETGRIWRPSQLNTTVNAQVDLSLRFPSQVGRQGLGSGNFNPNPTRKGRRKLCTAEVKSISAEHHDQHVQGLAWQGVWLKWHEYTLPLDLSWNNLIYGPGPQLIKFLLNAAVNWVKTPDLLRLWGYVQSARCKLCQHTQCTLHHIISACDTALNSKRYNWRHDSVLLLIKTKLSHFLDHRSSASPEDTAILPLASSFVPSGTAPPTAKKTVRRQSLLDGATDWKLLADFDNKKIVFPPEICPTSSRPDIVIWSVVAKRVVLIELTCPAEEGMKAAEIRKIARYSELMAQIKTAGWTPHLFTVEVGARGFVGRSTIHCLKKLGLSSRTIRQTHKDLSEIVARCTYAIYLARETLDWPRDQPLISPRPPGNQTIFDGPQSM